MIQAMAWCRQATSHDMSQCLPRSLAPYGVTRPHWVNLDIANHLLHVVWICPGNGLVPIRQQTFYRTHDDKDKMFKKWLHCINSNWKFVEYCNKEMHPSCLTYFFIWNSWCFWYSWPTILKYVYTHNNSQTCALRVNRQVCTGWALGMHWVSIRCALGEHYVCTRWALGVHWVSIGCALGEH